MVDPWPPENFAAYFDSDIGEHDLEQAVHAIAHGGFKQAEDAVYEAITELLLHEKNKPGLIGTFRSNDHLRRHLIVAARHRAIDIHRRGKKLKRLGNVQLADAKPEFDIEDLVQREQLVLLTQLLGRGERTPESDAVGLTPLQLRILQMIYRDGMTQADTADALGIDRRTVRRHQDEALRTLRLLLD